tara:strand:+ start:3501 stop:3926 length:426 start_codon:yes stop_codon:yes gene_type:complete
MTDDSGYQTIPALMLKDTDYAPLLHGESDIFCVDDALVFCDALEEVVIVWKEGLDAFGLLSQEINAPNIFGNVVMTRLLFLDLLQTKPQVSKKESKKIFDNLTISFFALVRSYSGTPFLAQWYSSLPTKAKEIYNRLRGER